MQDGDKKAADPAADPAANKVADKGASRAGLTVKTATDLFGDRDFRRLWLCGGCNYFAMTGELVILGLLVFRMTESSQWVGVSLALYYFPMLVFGVLSGAISDWMDRRSLLRRAEMAITANLALFAGILAIGVTELWLVLGATLMAGVLRAMHHPTRTSYAYDLIGGDRIVPGLGLINFGTRLGQLAGGLIVGFVMEAYGASAALMVLVVVQVISLFIISGLRSAGRAASTAAPVPFRQNLSEYLGEMRVNRVLLMLVLVTASVEIFGFSFATALPELAAVRFDIGADGLGLMHAARAAGGLLASVGLAAMGGLKRRGIAYLVVIYLFGGGLIWLSFSDHFLLAVAGLMLVAIAATASDVLTQSMVQLCVPNHLRGRAMGAWTFAVGSAPIGHLEMGALIVWLGVGGALLFNGTALIIIGVLIAFLVPRLRTL